PAAAARSGSPGSSNVVSNSTGVASPAARRRSTRPIPSRPGMRTSATTTSTPAPAAALREARRLAGARASRVGFHGGSQGGWVAPLAATRVDADFVVVGYGLAVSPLAEDRGEVMQGLVAAGFDDPGVLRKAREATDATATVIASGFERGYEQLDAVRARYGAEPWWPAIAGEFSGEMLRTDNDSIRRYGPLRVHGTT